MKYFKVAVISFLTFLFSHWDDHDDHSNHDSRKFQKGVISGIVVDSKTQDPIEYVSVSVKSLENNLVVSGGISDKDGYFYIDKLKLISRKQLRHLQLVEPLAIQNSKYKPTIAILSKCYQTASFNL